MRWVMARVITASASINLSCAENGFFDAQPSTDAFNRFGNDGVDLIVVHTALPFSA